MIIFCFVIGGFLFTLLFYAINKKRELISRKDEITSLMAIIFLSWPISVPLIFTVIIFGCFVLAIQQMFSFIITKLDAKNNEKDGSISKIK